jgi:hypothetical protein
MVRLLLGALPHPALYLFPPTALLMYKGGYAPFKTPKRAGKWHTPNKGLIGV